MDIVQNGHPALRKKAAAVGKAEFGTPAWKKLIKDMSAALDTQADGVALAAPQIGVEKRVFIVRYDRMLPDPSPGEPAREAEVGVYANPEMKRKSRKKAPMDEGCLSVRGTYGKVMRHERATVAAQDEKGVPFTRGAGGLLAHAFQHEMDHLDGILFIDKAESLRDVAVEDRPKRSRAQEGWKLEEHG